MKFTFIADPNNPRAVRAQKECAKRYGQETDLTITDVVIALGGDGTLLKILQSLLNYKIPVLGMNLGHVGHFLSHYSLNDLPDRVAQAERKEITPLQISVRNGAGKGLKQYAFNEFSFSRTTPQAARLEVTVQDQFGLFIQREVFGDGLIVATPMGSSGYYASAQGIPVDPNQDVIALQSICSKKDLSAIVSPDSLVKVKVIQERGKRPVCVDRDGQDRVANVHSATIKQARNKSIMLLCERKADLAR